MNLNDLMEVWRSQDAVPVHGVNETLLRLALRQDESKLQRQRRLEKRIVYAMTAFFVAVMGAFVIIMVHSTDDNELIGWDLAIAILGAAAALFWPSALHVGYRAQVRREQSFGDSLRDQLNRHIAQIDYYARRANSLAFHLVNNLPAMVWAVAFFLAVLRINDKPLADAWTNPNFSVVFFGMIFFCVVSAIATVWVARRTVKRDVLPHKHRLEALLKELDGQ